MYSIYIYTYIHIYVYIYIYIRVVYACVCEHAYPNHVRVHQSCMRVSTQTFI